MSTPPETLGVCKILSESRRIIKSQVHQFQVLSVLFLLPVSFSIIIYPTLPITIFKSQPDSSLLTQILIILLYIFFVTILSTCAVATISYTTFHGLYGRPVELSASIKSISHSFLPLVSTLIFQELYLALISFPCVYEGLKINGSESFYNSNPYYFAFIILLTLVFLLGLIHLQVKWILVSAIVVMESKWGLEPMQRSAQLVKGKRGVVFSLVLLFVLMVGPYVWVFYAPWSRTPSDLLYMTFNSVILTMSLLLSLVAKVVLYVYCVEMHGEPLPYSSVEEFPLLK